MSITALSEPGLGWIPLAYQLISDKKEGDE